MLQVSVVEEQRQESAKSDDENKDGDPSPNETEASNGKTDINDTPMDEYQVTRSFKCFTNL
jgi:hypothetical protein